MNEGAGVAATALRELDVSLEALADDVHRIVAQGTGTPGGPLPLTIGTKKVLELSSREALQLGHNYLGTEHLLLGLIREGDGVAATVLVARGADLSRARQAVIRVLIRGNEAGTRDHATGAPTAETDSSPLSQPIREVKLSALVSEIGQIGGRFVVFDDRVELLDRHGAVVQSIARAAIEHVAVDKKFTGSTVTIRGAIGTAIVVKGLTPDDAEDLRMTVMKRPPTSPGSTG